MRDDIDRARRSGYSDEQILSVLSDDPAQKAEIEGALKNGYTASQVLSVFQEEAGATKREAIKGQSWGDYAADLGRAVVYGAGQEAKAVGTALSKPADATGPNGLVNSAGDALQTAGALAQGQAAGYTPSQFDILHPIDTASELPKAAAEAAPGLGATLLAGAGAGATAGAIGGAVAGPPGAALGATLGGIGGAALYGLTRYTGQNAQAHADTQGRAKPTQADFDATRGESLAMAGVDAATLKAGGLIGKAARGGLALKAAQAGKTAGSLAAGGAINSAIGQTAAMDETQPDSDSLIERVGQVDLHEAANAGATGAALGGMVRGARIPAEIAGAIKYRAGGPINEAALKRVSDFMNSDAFPGDPQNRSNTSQTIRMARDHYAGTLDTFVKNADDLGLSESAKNTLSETNRYLKGGAVYSEEQLSRVQEAIGDSTVFRAVAERNAVNKISEWAGTDENRSLGERMVGAVLRNPGKAGAIGGALSEGLPLLTGGLSVASGGKLLAAGLAAKALSKASGMDRVMNDPLGSVAERYGTKAPNDPTAVTPFGSRTLDDYRALNEARNAFNEPAPAPVAPQAAPAAPAHPPLTDLIGATPPTRFAPQASPQAAPAPVERPTGRPAMSTSDILSEMRLQAEGEGRPLLEVAQEQHRSLRSMETNTRLPEPLRNAAKAQAHAIHTDILAPMEAAFGGRADPMVSRSRSFKKVEEAPAPAPVISEAGAMRLQSELAPTVDAIARSGSEGAARRTIESFIETFPVRDQDFVRQTLAQDPNVAKQTNVVRLKASAKASTAINRAKAPKTPKKRGRPRKNP